MSENSNFTELEPNGNFQFRNLTVEAGVTLNIPTGGIIRCTESFVNNGTIVVGQGGFAGGYGSRSGTVFPGPGIGRNAAGGGETGDNTGLVVGGTSGQGLTAAEAMMVLDVRPGGGGGLGYSGGSIGGQGGGGVLVLAGASILNTGTTRANGVDGTGVFFAGASGGAGGIVILASPGSVINSGLVSATGGDGNGSSNDIVGFGACGGGGGGIVRFMSPILDTGSGTVNVNGGEGGNGGTVSGSPRTGGSGGGGSGGSGGAGGYITPSPENAAQPGTDGSPGYVIESLTDPTPWFS